MLTKELRTLMERRQKAAIELRAATSKLIAKRDALQAEINNLAAPAQKLLDGLEKQIIAAAEEKADDIFADAKKHAHAGQVLKLTTGSAVECDDNETDVIASLSNVKGAHSKLAEACLKIDVKLNKAVIKSSFEGNEDFFADHGLKLVSNTYIKLEEEKS